MTTEHKFCSVGILGMAQTGTVGRGQEDVEEVLAGVIREHYPERVAHKFVAMDDHYGIITRFNDHDDTTFEDIERVFEKAEVAWDEKV